MLKEPDKKFDIVKFRDSGYLRKQMLTVGKTWKLKTNCFIYCWRKTRLSYSFVFDGNKSFNDKYWYSFPYCNQ